MQLEWGRLALEVLIKAEIVDVSALREREFVGFAAATPAAVAVSVRPLPTVWEALDHPAPGNTDPRFTVADHLVEALKAGVHFVYPLHDIATSLEYLAGFSTAELERLFSETLDTFAHRLDPWIGALLAETIDERRKANGTTDYHVGAFGWVEDLRAKPLPPTIPEGPLYRQDPAPRRRPPAAASRRATAKARARAHCGQRGLSMHHRSRKRRQAPSCATAI